MLGIVQLTAPKGTLPHRTIGWIWVALLAIIAISSFWIHKIRLWGPFSPIHLISIFALVMLPIGVWRRTRHKVTRTPPHDDRDFFGGLVIAGLFTFVPGRIMHEVFSAPEKSPCGRPVSGLPRLPSGNPSPQA